ncbi:MAG: Ferric transporter ATP-binding subunit [Dehalococcoidia bacterium]|nr:Ferric transporter ATP-binding subunit [Dehalococcoidia bacterium]
MKSKRLSLIPVIVILAILATILSCTPKSVPTAPASPVAPVPISAPASNIPTPTSLDATWAKVIEAAKKEGRLVIYGDSPFAAAGRTLATAFTAQYGIPIDLLILPGRQQAEKLKVERGIGKPVADVVQTGVSSSTEIVLSDLAESAVESLPVLKDRSVFYVDPVYGPQKQIIAFGLTYLGPVVNTNKVKPDEIKSWNDVLNPKWKGQIIMSDPRGTGAGLNLFSTLTYHKVLDYDYFRRLARQELSLWPGGHREAYLMVGRGEYAMDFGGGSSEISFLVMEGAPIKTIATEEGSVGQIQPVLLAKGAPHGISTSEERHAGFHSRKGEVYSKKDMEPHLGGG